MEEDIKKVEEKLNLKMKNMEAKLNTEMDKVKRDIEEIKNKAGPSSCNAGGGSGYKGQNR